MTTGFSVIMNTLRKFLKVKKQDGRTGKEILNCASCSELRPATRHLKWVTINPRIQIRPQVKKEQAMEKCIYYLERKTVTGKFLWIQMPMKRQMKPSL